MKIRKAVAADVAGVRRCAEEAYSRYIAAIGRKPAPMIADFEARIAASVIHLAVDEEDELQGFIVFFPREDHMFLENIAVREAASGNGIGKQLVRFCEAEAQRLGLLSVRLYTNEKMTENLSIYPHLGYFETGRHAEDGFNRVFFEKRLV